MNNVGYAERIETALINIYQTSNSPSYSYPAQTELTTDFAEPDEVKTLRLRRMKFLFAHNPEHLVRSGLISSLEELETIND